MDGRQVEIEKRMAERGAERYRNKTQGLINSNMYVYTYTGGRLMRGAIKGVQEAIEEWLVASYSGKPGKRRTAAKRLRECDSEAAAVITCRYCVNAVCRTEMTLTYLAEQIGLAVRDQVNVQKFTKELPDAANWIETQADIRNIHHTERHRHLYLRLMKERDFEPVVWPYTDRLSVGMTLIDMFIKTTGFLDIYKKKARYKRYKYFIKPTDAVYQWISEKNDEAMYLRPVELPMVEKPKPWTSLTNGGYHTDVVPEWDIVKRRGGISHLQQDMLKEADLSLPMATLNAIQETPWKVNKRAVEIARHFWDSDMEIAGIPKKANEERPPFPPEAEYDKNVRKIWRKKARAVYEKNVSTLSRRLAIERCIQIAEEFQDEEELYFPHVFDFRGRVYPIPTHLTPQGPDYSRGLLQFAKGKPINDDVAMGWLMVHGANCWGEDKISLEDRIKWVEDNLSWMRRCNADPLEHREWTEADKPFAFLCWLEDFFNVMDGGYGTLSYTPVSTDGSCNGLQHLSAMLRDPVGGKATNLVDADKPADIYQEVADVVIEKLKQEDDPEKEWIAQTWLQFGVSRKITKRPVMVMPYGGTLYSTIKYVREEFKEQLGNSPDPFGDSSDKAIAYLATLVHFSIGEVVIAAKRVMDWLKGVARKYAHANMAMTWTAPSGFVVVMRYNDRKKQQLRTYLKGTIIRPLDYKELPTVNPKAMANAVSPNLVHSYDAAALCLTIEEAQKRDIYSFQMIHDSFATHAADVDRMWQAIRKAFYEMYEEHDPLEAVYHAVCEDLPDEDIPRPPKKMSLDLSCVLNSTYFFA
jgi:DNA-directed RNA polymerase